MKEFFQGLVFGATLMYAYVHQGQGADFLVPFKEWFDGVKQKIDTTPRKKEADKMINGFFFPRDTIDGEKTARV
jgi:hypothetical protein